MNAQELDRKVNEIREYKRLIEEANAAMESVQDEIKQVMTERGVDELTGIESKVSWKAQTRTSIDTKRLTKERPEIAEEYGKTTSYKVFRIS